jgi:hypothetical protein
MVALLAPLLAALALGELSDRPASWGPTGPRSMSARRHWLQQQPGAQQAQPEPRPQLNHLSTAGPTTPRGVFNVMSYGAKADNQTDDTAAFASALAAAFEVVESLAA